MFRLITLQWCKMEGISHAYGRRQTGLHGTKTEGERIGEDTGGKTTEETR